MQYVGPGEEDDDPSFGHTIGPFGLRHPELVLVGPDADTTHGVLQRVAEEVAAGRDLVPGELIVWEDWAGRLCVETSPNPGEVVLGANRLCRRPPEYPVPAIQLAWSHADGQFPGRRATRAARGASRGPAPGGPERSARGEHARPPAGYRT